MPGGDGCARSAGGRAAVCGAPAGRVPVLGRFHHRRTPCLCTYLLTYFVLGLGAGWSVSAGLGLLVKVWQGGEGLGGGGEGLCGEGEGGCGEGEGRGGEGGGIGGGDGGGMGGDGGTGG